MFTKYLRNLKKSSSFSFEDLFDSWPIGPIVKVARTSSFSAELHVPIVWGVLVWPCK